MTALFSFLFEKDTQMFCCCWVPKVQEILSAAAAAAAAISATHARYLEKKKRKKVILLLLRSISSSSRACNAFPRSLLLPCSFACFASPVFRIAAAAASRDFYQDPNCQSYLLNSRRTFLLRLECCCWLDCMSALSQKIWNAHDIHFIIKGALYLSCLDESKAPT